MDVHLCLFTFALVTILVHSSPAETVEMEGEDLADFEAKFEDLCNQKIKIVEERNELVEHTEEERMRSVHAGHGRQQDMIDSRTGGQQDW